MSTNKTMKNKLVNTMRATKAGTSNVDTATVTPEKEAPVAKKAAAPAKKTTTTKKKKAAKPTSTGFSSPNRVWPD